MFHPIGSQSPSVYWRRRLLFGASLVLLVVLIVLTVNALTSGGDGAKPVAGGNSSSPNVTAATSPPAAPPPSTTTGPATSAGVARSSATSASTTPSRSSAGPTSPAKSSSSTPPPACVTKDLRIAAVPQRTGYHIGDRPVLQLRVTNTGSTPCVQDLADKQVELRVYNGESRVWGSHDCKIEPGTDPRTLGAGVPVLVEISWSGLTSQSPCTATRQRVGVGTYTLYGSLAGRTGAAGRFTIS